MVKGWIDLLVMSRGNEGEMVMVGRRRGDAAGVEIGVRRGGTGGTPMAKRDHIEGIGLGRGHIADRWTGRERSIHIEGNGRSATRGEEMMTGHRVGSGSGVIRQIHRDGGEVREIEIVITEDEEVVLDNLHVLKDSLPKGRSPAITEEAAIHALKRSKLTDRPY